MTDTMTPVDPADAPASTGVMLALLPITTEWCQIELPHLTLVYAGTTDSLKAGDFNELAKDASSLAAIANSVYLKVSGIDVMGDTEKVSALKLQPTQQLLGMRRFVERWNASKFPFDPHCTIGPVVPFGPVVPTPSALAFDRIMVGWGEDQLVFKMGWTC